MSIKTCAFWDCLRPIPPPGDLCRQHYRERQTGKIDRCLGCGRLKHTRYELCLDCYGGQSQPERRHTAGNPNAAGADAADETGYPSWPDTDWNTDWNGVAGALRERRSRYEVEESPAWSLGDARTGTFYAYLLKLKDGTFYPGQTRGLQARLMEHKDGRVKMTAGCQPRLVWFTQLSSREEAALMEVELKLMVDQNPREVRKLVVNFRNLLSDVDTEA